MSRYRTPLPRARALGAAHHGAAHWISERVSSIALVPLTLWAVYATIHLAPLPRDLHHDLVVQAGRCAQTRTARGDLCGRPVRLGVAHQYVEWPGAHTWTYWSTHATESLTFLLGAVGTP